jgi:hypothetical protein
MVLSQGHIRPGSVLQVVDNQGVIKASCCGLFSDVDEPEKLPPIYQFSFGGANNFYTPHEGEEIWVLFFDDNPLELFYIRKENVSENLNEILKTKHEECEVLMSKELTAGFVQFYFTDGEGWILRNFDSVIQMRADGSILLDAGSEHRKIDINEDSISIGSIGNSAHTAAYGDEVVTAFNKVVSILNTMVTTCTKLPEVAILGANIKSGIPALEEQIEKIESQHVTID